MRINIWYRVALIVTMGVIQLLLPPPPRRHETIKNAGSSKLKRERPQVMFVSLRFLGCSSNYCQRNNMQEEVRFASAPVLFSDECQSNTRIQCMMRALLASVACLVMILFSQYSSVKLLFLIMMLSSTYQRTTNNTNQETTT